MDRAIDSSATEEGRVGGIDDRVNLLTRDVSLSDFDPAFRHPGDYTLVSISLGLDHSH